MIAALLLAAPALAVRPTEGGLYAFDAADVVEWWDEESGRVRVHFSVDGPNLAREGDDDGDLVPDFAQEVAREAAAVLDTYAALDLREPLSEDDLGLSELGGSYAFDFYLVDFGGDADGMFATDACDGGRCAGFMVMENDFRGYGYPSIEEAIRVLTSHELFHAVQAAYDAGEGVWFSEGTAVWGELRHDPANDDFFWFADAYLEETSRSLDKPPTGPVPTFAYATCLWWDFLTRRHGEDLMPELLLAAESGDDLLADMDALIVARGEPLADAWLAFAQANLATGDRAGAAWGHPYGARLQGIAAEAEGASVDDDNRFYPLAASYFRLDHAGGPVWFAVEEPAPGLRFSLHPVEGGAADGPVGDPVEVWTPDEAVARPLAGGADQPAGGYWLVGTQPARGEDSIKVRLCLGDRAAATACAPAADTGDPVDTGDEEPGGCGCGGARGGGWAGLLVAALLLRRGRR